MAPRNGKIRHVLLTGSRLDSRDAKSSQNPNPASKTESIPTVPLSAGGNASVCNDVKPSNESSCNFAAFMSQPCGVATNQPCNNPRNAVSIDGRRMNSIENEAGSQRLPHLSMMHQSRHNDFTPMMARERQWATAMDAMPPNHNNLQHHQAETVTAQKFNDASRNNSMLFVGANLNGYNPSMAAHGMYDNARQHAFGAGGMSNTGSYHFLAQSMPFFQPSAHHNNMMPTPWALNPMTASHKLMHPMMASPFYTQASSFPVPPARTLPPETFGQLLPNSLAMPTRPVLKQAQPAPKFVPKECCRENLRPAEVPRDPLLDDDEWNNSTLVEREIAWLVEESDVFLPASANKIARKNSGLLPIVLDFAYRHGSLELRENLWEAFPSKVTALVRKLNNGENDGRVEFVDARDMLDGPHNNIQAASVNEKLARLRKEARSALQLGFRRSDAIEKELNAIHGFKWREAVEEVGEPGDGYLPPCFEQLKQPRHRRKRLKNAALLQTALGQDGKISSRSIPAAEAQARPPELTTLEDEIAWLVEESLILLPKDMIDPTNDRATESVISAGLVTKAEEINWDFVVTNASEQLSEELKRIGGIKRRPLQRLVRMHHKEVRVAFHKRRDDIARYLLLHGYRRNETSLSLPSHELLTQTGLQQVWAVRLMRKRQNETSEDLASSEDLRAACNQRIGGDNTRPVTKPDKSPKRKRLPPKLAVTQKAQSSILTAEEEEIAWVRRMHSCVC